MRARAARLSDQRVLLAARVELSDGIRLLLGEDHAAVRRPVDPVGRLEVGPNQLPLRARRDDARNRRDVGFALTGQQVLRERAVGDEHRRDDAGREIDPHKFPQNKPISLCSYGNQIGPVRAFSTSVRSRPRRLRQSSGRHGAVGPLRRPARGGISRGQLRRRRFFMAAHARLQVFRHGACVTQAPPIPYVRVITPLFGRIGHEGSAMGQHRKGE